MCGNCKILCTLQSIFLWQNPQALQHVGKEVVTYFRLPSFDIVMLAPCWTGDTRDACIVIYLKPRNCVFDVKDDHPWGDRVWLTKLTSGL